jgi:hypothetical protein
MIIFRRPQITEPPNDYLSEPLAYVTQWNEGGDGPGSVSCTEETIELALRSGKLIVDQALWLHDHHISWQIDIER